MILLIGHYRDEDPNRRAEFVECIRRNCANSYIEQVHIFLEDALDPDLLIQSYPELDPTKVRTIAFGRRLQYRDLFDYANGELSEQVVIIANADIFFDHSLARLQGYDLSGKLLCLSRWDVDKDGTPHLFDCPASQDAWIFQAPIRPFPCGFHLGVPGCDNRLAWEARNASLAVSNPSRSIRPYHLHASLVHRYTAAQRLSGAMLDVPAQTLGIPWLWFVVSCRGVLDSLQQNMDAIVSQPRSSCVLVDYDCPQEGGEWARSAHPGVTVISVDPHSRFHGAEARNFGAAAADEDAILCFLDADLGLAPSFSEEILARFRPGGFLVPDGDAPGTSTVLVCSKVDFDRVEGFDEAFQDTGEEVADLSETLARAGLSRNTYPSRLLTWPRQVTSGQSSAGRALVRAVHRAYRRAKCALLTETGGNRVSSAAMREIYDRIFEHQACIPAPEHPDDQTEPDASISIRESMGYTITCLEPGISSHNNETRPFVAVPRVLCGRTFTQVVASRVSSIEVELIEAGRFYVLVGTDWYGHRAATDWLREEAGRAEILPQVRTECGNAFEVWSLVRGAGEHLTVPTQVILVADRIEQT